MSSCFVLVFMLSLNILIEMHFYMSRYIGLSWWFGGLILILVSFQPFLKS